MQQLRTSWTYIQGNQPNWLHHLLSRLSLHVRNDQLMLFMKLLKPGPNDRIADIGVSSVEELIDTNYFEKNYPYPKKLLAVSIDAPLNFNKKYPQIKYQQIISEERLPFDDKNFDLVVSWATLEHVGGQKQQALFLSELFRIGKKVFITTPYRGCFYEPHSNLIFLHWLPWSWFQKLCRLLHKDFWASEQHLRCLWKHEVRKLLSESENTRIITYRLFGFLPSHLIIVKTTI